MEKLLLKIPEAAELVGLGRSKLYELMPARRRMPANVPGSDPRAKPLHNRHTR